MTWKKVRNMMVMGLAGAMILGNVISAGAAEGGTGQTDGKITFKAGEDEGGPDEPEPPFPPIGDSLRLNYVPTLDFGEVAISNEDKAYYAKAQYTTDKESGDSYFREHYIEVSDLRGNNKGWNVTVNMDGQFRNASTQNKELTGTTIVLKDLKTDTTRDAAAAEGDIFAGVSSDVSEMVLKPNETQVIFKAEEEYGQGRWYRTIGTKAGLSEVDADGDAVKGDVSDSVKDIDLKFNPAIQLKVPGDIAKDTGVEYKTTLTWVLSDTPGSGTP